MSVSSDVQLEVANFLFAEANLLEENRLHEWLDLLTDDVRYSMPIRSNPQPTMHGRNSPEGLAFGYYDEDKDSLTLRVQRLDTGLAHAELPATITQRMISNIRVEEGDTRNELIAHSSFLIYQERRGRYSGTIVGKRRDKLRRENAKLKISERHISLAQTILPSTVSIFF